MNCHKPFVGYGGQAFGCGQCLPCRINRRRIWTHRIKLEAAEYVENVFLTLTYAEDCLPLSSRGLPTLQPLHLKNFMHRVRSAVRRSPELGFRRIRFFAVGEYGDISFRPHYHVVLFNYPGCLRGRTRSPPLYKRCCVHCDLLYDLWYDADVDGERRQLGKIELLPLSHALMNYIGGYVTKKMTRVDDPRLEGRHPEFARQSNRPYGIGAGALHDVADVLMRYYDVAGQLGDVPTSLGSPNLPLGRYMRGKLREMVGMPKNAPQVTLDKIAAEVRPLQLATIENAKKGGDPSLKNAFIEANKGRTAGIVARYNIRKKGKPL